LYDIPKKVINYKLGTVNVEDMIRFLKAYKNYTDNYTSDKT